MFRLERGERDGRRSVGARNHSERRPTAATRAAGPLRPKIEEFCRCSQRKILVPLHSRTITRTFVVCSVLLFALQGRLTQGVRTAYDSGWTVSTRGCSECRLPNGRWVWIHTASTVLLVVCLLAALWFWWSRRRRELPKSTIQKAKEAHAPLLRWAKFFRASALSASVAAAVFTYRGDREDHRGDITLASGLELAALALVAATGLLLANTSRSSAEGPTTAEFIVGIRKFLQRQRIALIAVLFLVLIMIGIGQTAGQAVDMMRVWTDYGDDRSLARLSFGIASSLLLALVIYEGGMRLARIQVDSSQRRSVAAQWWLLAGAGVGLAWVILYLLLHRSLGWGLLFCAGILLALALLEWGKAERKTPAPLDVGAKHEEAVGFLAVVPMLTLAVVSLFAAVDSGLAGSDGREILLVFIPGAVLAAFAVLMTTESSYEPLDRPWWIWLLGGALFILATGLLIWFQHERWGFSSVVGFSLSVLAAGYAISVFRWRCLPLLGPIGGWRLSLPVALATGLTTFLLVHLDPEGFGQTLGSFALVNLSLAFILTWLPWAVGWSLERKPPRVLSALGFQQLPIVSLVALAWILAGVVKPPATLHNVRLVDRPLDLPRPALNEVFQSWVDAQDDLEERNSAPVPLVLVAAHGGGIKAAYWTALVLDCIVGVSPAGFEGTNPKEADAETCKAERRNPLDQQTAARRIFLASSVSGGAMGMYAYARQLRAEGWLGTEVNESSASWVNRRLARDFVSPTIAWGLFHDVPNHIIGLHPRERGVCAWHLRGPCATMDRGTVLERSFDNAFGDVKDNPTLRGSWERRASSSKRAKAVPLLVGNATVSGGQARAVISAADLSAWPSLEGSQPPGGDPRPLAGTVEVGDTLCSSNDLRLSTASLLAGRFPYVNPSGHLEALCGAKDDKVKTRDKESNCAQIEDPGICELNLVDGGYTENSGLFTIVALWPALSRLVMAYNMSSTRDIALVIVELDNHYRPRARDVPRGSNGKSETLIPPATAFGAHGAAETFARAAAQRLTGVGCTLTISPRLHPGLVAPLGWELSEGAREDLRKGLVEPRPNAIKKDERLAPVLDLRRLQAWLGGEQVQGLDTSLESCVPD